MRRLMAVLRRRLPEFVLAATSTAVVCLLLWAGEALSRQLDPGYLTELPPTAIDRLHVYSERLGWEPRPGAHYVMKGHALNINRQGFRGREVEVPRVAARQRLLLMGDSIAFGWNADDKETFAHLLDTRDQGREVVNLAVQGYGPGQSLLRLEQELTRFEPDLVVFNLCLDNDPADVMLERFLYDDAHPKPYFRLEGGRLRLHDSHLALRALRRLGVRLGESSHLYNRLRSLWVTPPGGPSPSSASEAELHWSERKAQAVRQPARNVALVRALMRRMREAAEQNDARLIVVLHPNKRAYRHGSRWIKAFTNPQALPGMHFLDLREAYRARGLRFRDVALDGIGHLTRRGHEVAAEVLVELLTRSGLDRHRARDSNEPNSD